MATASRSRPIERAADRGRRRAAPAPAPKRDVGVTDRASLEAKREPPTQPVSLETVAALWWSALDAAETALYAASASLTAQERRELGARLASERASTVELLEDVARAEGVRARFSHLLVSRSNLRRLLGLPSAVTACVFNLDGVLIGSAALHVAAWTETFDEFILARVERTGGRFAPFNPRTDYQEHIHGKPRLEGVRAFLASRGISLPDGDAADPPGMETVHGLANRKKEALLRRIEEQGVSAFEGSRRYLETARDAGLHRAVVSASVNTDTILERAGLAPLIEQSVDGNTILAERLRTKPAPDILLAACRMLGVRPEQAAAFETSPAGVAAARAGGFDLVIGVDPGGHAEPLLAQGADLVVSGLAELLERSLPTPSRRR
jgi:HAD superfamily hydrolase (TIGR01509 family)